MPEFHKYFIEYDKPFTPEGIAEAVKDWLEVPKNYNAFCNDECAELQLYIMSHDDEDVHLAVDLGV